VAARRLSRALRAARTLRSSRASACGVGTCILAPALANATVRGARAAGVQGTARWWGVLRLPRDQAQRWRGTSDDAPHVRLHRHSAPGDLSVSRLEPRRVEVSKVSHARLWGKMKELASRTYK
jgi:hypothetical protein